MTSPADDSRLTDAELAALSALADGTLDSARRPEVEAWISASPQLTALYERERRVVAALRHARTTDRAPARLRARIDGSRPSKAAALRRRARYGGVVAAGLAAAALALVLVLPSGAPGGPSVSQAAALGDRGPVLAAPAPDPRAPAIKLAQSVGEVYFPNWATWLHWRAVGQRVDMLAGRRAVTVYYAWEDERVAYTIVSAPALAQPAASVSTLNGTELRTLSVGGRLVVTWRRAGRTCVLSGSGLTAVELQKLAAWRAPAASR